MVSNGFFANAGPGRIAIPWSTKDVFDAYARSYGADAVRDVLDALPVCGMGWEGEYAVAQILLRIAQPEQAEKVLQCFRFEPLIAETACRIASEQARRVVEEQLPAIRAQRRVPRNSQGRSSTTGFRACTRFCSFVSRTARS